MACSDSGSDSGSDSASESASASASASVSFVRGSSGSRTTAVARGTLRTAAFTISRRSRGTRRAKAPTVRTDPACYPSSVTGTRPSFEPEPPRGEWFSDEPPMETYQHLMQMIALIATLRWHWRGRTDYFVGGNLTVYYSPHQRQSEDFRGPDFFVVLDVDGTRPRRSWVVWEEEGRYPNVIVELLSDSTLAIDRGEKLRIYQDVFRTPEYFLFDPHSGELTGFRLVGGHYQPIAPDADGRLDCDQLGLRLGVLGDELRLFTREGILIETPEGAAESALRRAEQETARADRAEAELAALRRRRT
jgi:Uma2 family endonuclease